MLKYNLSKSNIKKIIMFNKYTYSKNFSLANQFKNRKIFLLLEIKVSFFLFNYIVINICYLNINIFFFDKI